MSRVLATVGLIAVGLVVVFLAGFWLIPALALCVLFCGWW